MVDNPALNVLIVCTANICRSPFGELRLRTIWDESGLAPASLVTASAGVKAVHGLPQCQISMNHADCAVRHTSREVQNLDLSDYDLIITMERIQRGLVAASSHAVRPRLFTLREAAQLAEFVTEPGNALDAASGLIDLEDSVYDFEQVPPLPNDSQERIQWLLGEMDAWRGQVPQRNYQNPASSIDIPDPHEATEDIHKVAFAAIDESLSVLVSAVTEVISR